MLVKFSIRWLVETLPAPNFVDILNVILGFILQVIFGVSFGSFWRSLQNNVIGHFGGDFVSHFKGNYGCHFGGHFEDIFCSHIQGLRSIFGGGFGNHLWFISRFIKQPF